MFLPTTLKEVRARGWDQLDVILFTGDAYIDHPSFGAAVVGRLLEAEGYRVAIVPQPNWRDDLRDFTKLGTPRLFFGVTAGAMDSMVNHYTANIRLRSNDAYTPGGKAGFRPDYAVKTYTQILKRLFPRTPVVIGGIEASLRRLTHYDYWSDSLHPSILADSGADLLIYGMGERVIQQVARAMNNGFNAKLLRNIRQVGFMADRSYVERLDPTRTIRLHSYEECVADKRAFGKNFTRIETLSNLMEPDETLVEGVGDRYAVITPPNATLTTEELDHSFDLPYERAPHPRYRGRGDIPAWEMIKHSVNIHRGCFGGCSFCTISAHRSAVRAGAAPPLPGSWRHSGLGDDQALGQYPPGLFRRLLLLHHIGPPGQVHHFAQRKIHPSRSRAGDPHARFPGLPFGHRSAFGQHVPHGRPRPGAVQQMPPSVVPASEDVPQPR